MRLGSLPLITILLLASCGADTASALNEAGPTSCAAIKDACEGLELGTNDKDPLSQCQLAAHGDDETECASLDEQLNCLDRCDAAQ